MNGDTRLSERRLVDVAIVNWNGARRTIDAATQVLGDPYSPLRLTVLDNGSVRSDRAELESWHGGLQDEERVTLLKNERNAGFAGGQNRVIAECLERSPEPAYFLCLNNDVTIPAGAIGGLVRVAERTGAGVLSPIVVDRQADGERGSTLTGRWGARPLLQQFFQPLFSWEDPPEIAEGVWESLWVSGAAMLLDRGFVRELVEDRGSVFEEDLFLYWEDIEVCWQARRRGWPVATTERVPVIHEGAASSGGMYNPLAYYYQTRNRILMARRMLSPFQRALFHPYNAVATVARFAKAVLRRRDGAPGAILRGYLDGLSGVTGRFPGHDEIAEIGRKGDE